MSSFTINYCNLFSFSDLFLDLALIHICTYMSFVSLWAHGKAASSRIAVVDFVLFALIDRTAVFAISLSRLFS